MVDYPEEHQSDIPTLPLAFKTNLGNERFVDLLNDILKEYTLLYEENRALVSQLEALKVQPNVRNVKFYQSDVVDTKKPKVQKPTHSHYVNRKTTDRWSFLHNYMLHRDCVLDVSCSPWDGSIFATAGADRCARIATAEEGKCIQFLPHPRPVTSVTFHQTEHLLGTSCGDGNIRVFRVGSEEEKPTEEKPLVDVKIGQIAVGVAFNGESMYTASWDGVVGVYNVKGEHLSSITASISVQDHITSLAADLYSPLLSCTATDGSLRLFDIRTPSHARIECINAHTDSCLSSQFCDGGKAVVSIGFDKVVKVWDTKMMKVPKATYKVFYPTKLSASPTDKLLVQSEDKSWIVIDPNGLRHGKLKIGADALQREHLRLQVCSCFSNDESVLYTGGLDRHVVAWCVQSTN
ncbi:WD repeat-containing protein 37 [Entamoeba marina]